MLANSIVAMYSYCVMSIVQVLIRCPITCMKCLLCLFLKLFIHDAMIRRFPWSYIHFGLNAHKNEICIYHILILITALKEAALVICLFHSSLMRCMSTSVQCRKRKDILMEDNEWYCTIPFWKCRSHGACWKHVTPADNVIWTWLHIKLA